MKTHLFLTSALFAASLTISGCGGGSGGGGGRDDAPDNGGGDGGEVEAKDCPTQWQEKVAEAPVGQVKAYDIVEATVGTGDADLDQTVISRSREEVVSATDEAIVTKTRWEYFQPALGITDGENRLTKENFMLTCSPNDVGDPTPDPLGLARAGVTIREDRTESITVKAGTFDARYMKIHVDTADGLDNEVLGDHWTINDETVVVKEKMVVTSITDGVTSTRTTERELIEYVAAP